MLPCSFSHSLAGGNQPDLMLFLKPEEYESWDHTKYAGKMMEHVQIWWTIIHIFPIWWKIRMAWSHPGIASTKNLQETSILLSVEMPCSPLDVHPESISRPREHIIFIIIFPYIKVLHSHTNYIFPWTSPLNKLESFGLMQVIKVGSRLLRIALTEEVASITPEASPRTNCGPVRLWVLCIGMLPAKWSQLKSPTKPWFMRGV